MLDAYEDMEDSTDLGLEDVLDQLNEFEGDDFDLDDGTPLNPYD